MHNVINDRATEYARRVVNGQTKHRVGRLHFLACQRHLKDLEKQRTDAFPYYYDISEAERIVDYAETLTIAEGDAPKPVKLIDSQVFDLAVTFGWFKTSNNKRRFRRRYKCVARQNGKSFENGILGTYISGFSSYRYGKLFTVATKKRQARIAWEEMSKFINIDPDLKYDRIENTEGYFLVKDYKSLIECIKTHCTIEALSKEAGLDDGFRSIFSSIDELHQHKDNKIYKAIYDGTRSLPETLVSMITTRGDNLSSFCKEMDDYCVKVLEGLATAEDFFVDIYSLDEGDDIWDEENWAKANPFIFSEGNEELVQTLRNDAATAKDMGGDDLKDFIIKCLNMWFESGDKVYIKSEDLKKCESELTLEDFKGCDCWVGVDLSSGGDLTSYSLLAQKDDVLYVDGHSFMPRGRFEEHLKTDLAPYDLWEQMGLLTVTGGNTDFKNDYLFLLKHLKETIETYQLNVLSMGVDPHNFDGIRAAMEALGYPIIIVKQSARTLNDSTEDFRLSVKSGFVKINSKNELILWSISNAETVSNSFGEIKIDKKDKKRSKRIDPVDALIDANYCRIGEGFEDVTGAVSDALDDYLSMIDF